MSESSGENESDTAGMKEQIEDLDYQGDLEAVQRLTEEGRRTLDAQLDSLDDIDTKAVAILRINVLLVGLLFTAASFIANSDLELTIFDNWAFYTGVISLLLSSALATLTYTASTSEVGIGGDKISNVIDAGLTKKQFELAVAQSQIYWISFNDKTNLINAPLITLTNLLLVISLFHLSLGFYIGLGGEHTEIIGWVMWVLLIIIILSSNIIAQLNELRKDVDVCSLRPW